MSPIKNLVSLFIFTFIFSSKNINVFKATNFSFNTASMSVPSPNS